MTKQDFLALLADNQMQQLFNELKSHQHQYLRDLVLLESQWTDLQTRERNGTLSLDQSNLEAARIRRSLLDLIEHSFRKSPPQASIAPASPGSSAFPKWILVADAICVVVGLSWGVLQSTHSNQSETPGKLSLSTAPATSAVGGVQVQVSSPSTAAGQPKMLEVPAGAMSFNKNRSGDITFKFLSAELSEQNPDNWLLRIKARAIKPAYGAHVGSSMFHIAYGDFEKVPVLIDFPGLGPGETADGVMEFEIPKAYREANVLIYHDSEEPPLATIPFRW